ncbi:hypothetical protein I5S86_10790 [Priestia aryabhattai]|nr:hypothetical protein I5S86_10790 [Priestia aryabhattai]
MTVRARTHFTVKEHDGGKEPWICIEYLTAEDGMPQDTFGFDLPVGTTYEQAKEIARYMNDHIEQFSVTKWP